MVSERTKKLIELDKAHILHGFAIAGQHQGIVFDKADGVYLWDTDGNKYIDGSSMAMCVSTRGARSSMRLWHFMMRSMTLSGSPSTVVCMAPSL